MAQQHRQIVQLHGLGALDQEVTDVGPDIAFHIVIDAVFYRRLEGMPQSITARAFVSPMRQ